MVEPKKEKPEAQNDKTDGKVVEKKKPEKEVELSEEDKQLQDELNMCVERLVENDATLYKAALESMQTLIKAATTSMTSVPKPLKFLRPHYESLKTVYEKITEPSAKTACADVISVLGMTIADNKRDCLKYKMFGGGGEIDRWGHEYVRHLTGEVAGEWQELTDADGAKKQDLLALAKLIVPYLMSHNTEAEACDLLMEIEQMGMLLEFVDLNVYQRVCLYINSCVPFVPDPENTNLLKTCLAINRKFNKYPESLRLAIQLNDIDLITEIFTTCPDKMIQKQMAYMLGRQQIFLELDEETPDYDELVELMSNSHLNNNFLALGRELDIMEPKVPEDIFKSHLEPSRLGGSNVDSARANLAASFVNGFVNCGFGQDKLLMEDGNKWLYKNKEHGMMSATATLGMILLWDVDGGLTQIDKYLYSNEDWIKAGALLACGIVNSGVKNECDPALALLSDYTSHQTTMIRIGSIVGLSLAYAGSNREDVLALLLPVLGDAKASMEVVGMAALACGMISVGSCNGEVTSTILQTLMEKSETDLKSTYARFIALGLALTYLGKQEAADAILAALQVVAEPVKSMAEILVDVCAYAGTGNVLKIQNLLHICSEHYDERDEDNNDKSDKKESKGKADAAAAAGAEEKMDTESADPAAADAKEKPSSKQTAHQGIAVIGIALIAMGEEIGSEMCIRSFGNLLRYGETVIKRAVPLALALLSPSNPRLQILDTLSKFSHDSDQEVCANSILSMGIVGAGTNNARLGAMLRQLAVYHSKDPSNLFMVRLAQGLTHLGKGTLTLSPFHSDRSLMHPVVVAGLVSSLIACLDVKTLILGKSHYILFNLVAAIQPRMLTTFDEELRPLPVTVRVGQAVDVVGQAGKPKTITGFQTHTTPVLLAHGERAELATEEYIALTPILEGFVILKKNPDYEK